MKNNGWNTFYEKEKDLCVRIFLGSSMERISRVKDSKERKELIQKTFKYLKKNYPNYVGNRYFKGERKQNFKDAKYLERELYFYTEIKK